MITIARLLRSDCETEMRDDDATEDINGAETNRQRQTDRQDRIKGVHACYVYVYKSDYYIIFGVVHRAQ